MADAVESAVTSLSSCPGEHAGCVELFVYWVESASVKSCVSVWNRECAHSALGLTVYDLVWDCVDFTVSVAEVKECSVEVTPCSVFGDPE